MSFDFNKYKAEEFTARTADVPVPELADWFEGEPVWTVRALSAVELAKVRDSVERNGTSLKNLIASLIYTTDNGGAISDIQKKMDDQVPSDIVRRYELLMAGSVSPEVKEKGDAIHLGKHHPGTLYEITNKILELTGQGSLPGKQKPCGETKPSREQ